MEGGFHLKSAPKLSNHWGPPLPEDWGDHVSFDNLDTTTLSTYPFYWGVVDRFIKYPFPYFSMYVMFPAIDGRRPTWEEVYKFYHPLPTKYRTAKHIIDKSREPSDLDITAEEILAELNF